MSALTDFAEYRARLLAPREFLWTSKGTTLVVTGRMYDNFAAPGNVQGAAPTSAVALDRTSTGAMGQENAGSEELFMLGGNFTLGNAAANIANGGTWILCDRLSHQGGLSGTVTGVVTTNLPTAALTRYTSGEGVMAGVTIYSTVGTTATTITCTYTNQAGTGSRVSPLTLFGGVGWRETFRMILIPLVTGDTGVRSIQNSTIAASTTTAGNFGYTLFKPLMAFHFQMGACAEINLLDGGMSGGLPVIEDDACLFWLQIPSAPQPQSTSSSITGTLSISAV